MDKKAQLNMHLSAARKLVELADSEEREFSAEERKSMEYHLAEAQRLKTELAAEDPESEKQKNQARDENVRKLVRELGGEQPQPKSSAGSWSKAFSERMSSKGGRKEILPPSGTIGVPSLSSVVPAQSERLETMLQVISTEPTSQESVQYLREVERTQRAAPVSKGQLKPTSTYELEEINAPVETIAHLSDPIPNQYLGGATLKRYLDIVLRQGLQLALEDQLINGSNTRPELQGMLRVNGHALVPFAGDYLATARKGITMLELMSLPLDGAVFVIHPSTWEYIELLEVPGGEYKMDPTRQPINRSRRQLWGAPVAPSVAMPEDKLLLFHQSAVQLFEKEGVQVSWTENFVWNEDGYDITDGFSRNVTKFRCEGIWTFAIYVASGIVEIDLSGS